MASRKSTTVRKATSPGGKSRRVAEKDAADAAAWGALTFEGIKVDPEKFTAEWDHARGFVARVAACLAVMSDKEIEAKFGESAEKAHTLMDAHDAMMREIEYLKLHSEMLDRICMRALVVASRFDPKLKRPASGGAS